MSDLERLSMLLAGDLPDNEAVRMRERVAVEPELAAAWGLMQGLPGAIESLEREAPPKALDALVLGQEAGSELQTWRRLWLGTGLLAAMAAGWLLVSAPAVPPSVVLTSGVQWVDGDVTVFVGDVQIHVDGVAEISVEPPAGFVREGRQEDFDMTRTHLVAAFAGAAIAVTVLQGSAIIEGPDSSGEGSTHLGPGDHWERRDPPQPPPPPVGTPLPGPNGFELSAKQRDLRDENEALRRQLASLQFAHGLAKGQLKAAQGGEQLWPDDVPESLHASNFEATLLTALAADANTELIEVECSEYPCLAILRSKDLSRDSDADMTALAAEMEAASGASTFSVTEMATETSGDGENIRMHGVGYASGDVNPDLQRRTQYRLQILLEDAVSDRAKPQATQGRPERVEGMLETLGYLGD